MVNLRVSVIALCVALIGHAESREPARAHDIYTGVRGKTGMLCCGGSDCAATTYRLDKGRYSFATREAEWVEIPEARIQFLPIPGDQPSDADEHRAHLCYRKATDYDRQANGENVFADIYLYCAFIVPGSI